VHDGRCPVGSSSCSVLRHIAACCGDGRRRDAAPRGITSGVRSHTQGREQGNCNSFCPVFIMREFVLTDLSAGTGDRSVNVISET